jgi:hypothetical protein
LTAVLALEETGGVGIFRDADDFDFRVRLVDLLNKTF